MKYSTVLLTALQLGSSFAHVKEASVEERSLASDIWNEIKSDATCTGCAAILETLKGLASLSTTLFVDTIEELCIVSGAQDSDVCNGAVGMEGPILAQQLKSMSITSHTSQLFCITFFGLCDFPAVTPWTPPFPSAKPATSRPATSGQTPIQIVHFSDIHVDPTYVPGSSYNCTKPQCCRSYTTAEAPGNNQYPAGAFGEPECDSPVTLEQSMYAAIKNVAPNAALSLFTGDIVDHAVWLDNKTGNMAAINDAYSKMSGLPSVFGTAGNHEASPVNAFPPLAMTSAATGAQWIYDTLSAKWSSWVGATAATEADKFGAYSSKVSGTNLRIISINTNLYYKGNYWLYEKTMETDPSGQFAWLVSELAAAETAMERVYIIGHMPFGVGDAFRDPSNYFDQIVNRYSATIAALFFGHTHTDQFEIAYSDYTAQTFSNAVEVSYIAPSMVPGSTGNPAFRVYTIDPVTYAVLDFDTYVADMSSSTYQTSPVWTKTYSAKSAYGSLLTPPLTDPTAELTPAFWHNVTVAFENNDSAFQAYIGRKSRGMNSATCTGTCKTNELCAIRAAQSQYNCATISFGINFKRDTESGEVKREVGTYEEWQCEGSLMRGIMQTIVGQHGLLEDGVEKAKVKHRKMKN